MFNYLFEKRALVFIAVFIIFFVTGIWIGGGKDELSKVKLMRPALGTVVEITIKGDDSVNIKRGFEAAFAEIERIDRVFTDYNDSSAVGQINITKPGDIATSPEVARLIKRSLELSIATGGAFDITVGGLIHLWGFKNETMHIPDVDSLERVRSVVGWKNLTIVDESVVRKKTDLKIDLGGIAKGYAVDRAWEVLDRMGIESFLINAGGEIRCKGDGWTAGIQDPTDPGQVKVVIAPNDKAVATSGDYQNYFEVDGTRYCHIFDPSTGFPAEKVASVTVLADDVATADALATALFVAGLEKSTEIMKKFAGCEYIVIGKDGKLHFSTGAKGYLLK